MLFRDMSDKIAERVRLSTKIDSGTNWIIDKKQFLSYDGHTMVNLFSTFVDLLYSS